MKLHFPKDLGLSSIALGELAFGAYRSGPNGVASNLASVRQLQTSHPVVAFGELCALEYGRVRESLTSAGTPIGANDMLIAAQALAHNLTLVTHNTREFGRVAGLKIEDWQI
jgi:tRNA(fMet)-specific endonuclease VapC